VENIYTKIKIYNFDKTKSIKKTLMVDTGFTYSWISGETLEKLDIKPVDEIGIKTIEGKVMKKKSAEAIFQYDGKQATRIVVFADKKDVEVIGVDTLEGLQLEVDPINRKLKKVKEVFAI